MPGNKWTAVTSAAGWKGENRGAVTNRRPWLLKGMDSHKEHWHKVCECVFVRVCLCARACVRGAGVVLRERVFVSMCESLCVGACVHACPCARSCVCVRSGERVCGCEV